jgi:hypothetical protein
MSLLECAVRNCPRQPVWEDDYDGELLCERHMPDPSVRSWAEMKADGVEIETMAEYAAEVRGFSDFDPPEPPDPYDLDDDRYFDEDAI